MAGFTRALHSGQLERAAAVAGSFYSADSNELRNEVENYFKSVTIVSTVSPQLIISPHAGYVFSGAVAAKAYAHLSCSVKRVIIVGPSHYQGFVGVAYPEVSWYLTPLGKVRVDNAIVQKLKSHPKARPASGVDDREHCLEVQLPFLQVKLQDFSIVPLLTGKIDPEELADMIVPFIDKNTIVVASSDLSHYHVQKDARKLDDQSVSVILGDSKNGTIDGCGEVAIRTIMHIAHRLELVPVLLDAKTSYETAPRHCSDDRVVGYTAIMYVDKTSVESDALDEINVGKSVFSKELQEWMLLLARQSLFAAVHGNQAPVPNQIPAITKEMRGCFITLTKNGALRGCIGYIEPIKPLYQAIIENARNAAMNDHRFPQLTIDELKDVTLEVSVLTKPEPLLFESPDDLLKKLRIGIDGVILSSRHKQSTFLPQVWEQLPQKVEFLEHLALKAGMARDEWKTADVKIYSAEHFRESVVTP